MINMVGTNWLGYDMISPISGTDSFAPNDILPSSGADPQDWYYLFYSMPGSTARRFGEERVCNPLWNVYGCREAAEPDQVTAVVPKDELPPQYQAEGETEDDEAKIMAQSAAVTSGYSTLNRVMLPVAIVSAIIGIGVLGYDKFVKRG
jgi:hypothetical protein|tara:strand:- start:539 stop:982 length:444 start_codon:yes stop_codon:yes gene_type:complete